MTTEEKPTELTKVISNLKEKYEKLSNSPFQNFKDYINKRRTGIGKRKEYPKTEDLISAGVYCIYENQDIIYVGSAGSSHTLRHRIGDLFVYNENSKKNKFHHTLTYKLIYDKDLKRFDNINKVREFYFEKCRFKYIKTKRDAEAHALEYLLIMLFKPPFNNETKNQHKQ